MKLWHACLIAGLLAGGAGVAVLAADSTKKLPDGAKPAKDDRDAIPEVKSERVIALAGQLGVSSERVKAMRNDGMGNGESFVAMALANKLALASDPPLAISDALDKVLASRESGKGWGQVAKSYDLTVGEAVSSANHMLKTDKPEGGKAGKTKADKPESGGKPDKVGRPEKPMKPEKADRPEKPEKAHGKSGL